MTTFTVCVPSYNRGEVALHNVAAMRRRIPAEVRILVLDNASTRQQDAYRELSRLPGVDYIRHEAPRGFYGNFLASLTSATTDVAVLVSDEDVVPASAISVLQGLEWERLAIARGSVLPMIGAVPQNSVLHPDEFLPRGAQAIRDYGFTNSYLSGTAYNLRLIAPAIEKLAAHLEEQRHYPHLYLEALATQLGDIRHVEAVTAYEGAPDVVDADARGPNQYDGTYGIGARLDQHVSLRDACIAAASIHGEWDAAVFAAGYLALCRKTMYLVSRVDRTLYTDAGLDVMGCIAAAREMAIACVIGARGVDDAMLGEISRTFGWGMAP